MQELFNINGDLITNSVYSKFFEEQLHGQRPYPESYVKLALAIRNYEIPKIGMIIDEAQALFEAKDK